MAVTVETYERVALEDSDERWELVCGHLRAKPPMTMAHGLIGRRLVMLLALQLDWRTHTVAEASGRVRAGATSFFQPDVSVIPMTLTRKVGAERTTGLEVYEDPLPLIVEIWSPSTGEYDVDAKLPEYRRRGDLEIWRIHPYDKTITVWRRQPDGSYTETLYRSGRLAIASLPGVVIDFADLFE